MLISSVEPNSPAEKSGIKEGDVITQLNGKPINTPGTLVGEIAAKKIGDNVELTIIRDKKEIKVNVKLEKMSASAAASTKSFSGIQIKNATQEELKKLNLPTNIAGVLVTSVDPNSSASDSGLQPGMLIKSLNRITTSDIETFEKVYNQIESGTQVLILVRTSQGDRYTTIVKD